jgi:hypothetical protein
MGLAVVVTRSDKNGSAHRGIWRERANPDKLAKLCRLISMKIGLTFRAYPKTAQEKGFVPDLLRRLRK